MKIEQGIIIGIVIIVGYFLYAMIAPFLTPIFWAVVFAIVFYPLYQWIKAVLGIRDHLASFITCVFIVLFLTVPAVLAATALVNEALSIYEWVDTYVRESTYSFHNSAYFLPEYIRNMIGRFINVSNVDFRDIMLKGTQEVSNFVVQNLTGIITNFTSLVLNLLLMVVALFYLFKDGENFLVSFMELLPLSKKDKDVIFKKSRDVIHATLYGGVLVAIVQGSLGGLSFWLLGLSSPIFWASMMSLFSFIPMVGPPIIWLPAAIYLFFRAYYIKAFILILIGVFIIGLVDNILRPIIVSGKTKIHPLLLLFSILGGLKTMGFIGIIGGPIILSFALTIIEIYRAGYLHKIVED